MARARVQGGVQLTASEMRWVLVDPSGETPRIVDGGLEPLPLHAPWEELHVLLGALFRDPRIPWSVTVPTRLRTALVPLPPLSGEELAQGMRFQAEKLFRRPDAELATGFEVVTNIDDVDQKGQTALVVSMPRLTLQEWVERLGLLPRPPRRLEPTLTAFERTLRGAPQLPGSDVTGTISLYGEPGSGGIAIHQGRRPLLVRCLTPPPDAEPEDATFLGEGGLRTVLETLLACEDRHPLLQIDALRSCGDIDSEWIDGAARATGLDRARPLATPGELSPELATGDRWLVPWGAALGGLA